MKKTIFITLAIASITMVSCDKEKLAENFYQEISTEKAQITLSDSGFDVVVTDQLISSDDLDYYTDGAIDYIVDGDIVATVDFGDGVSDSKAHCFQGGTDRVIDLRITDRRCNDRKSKYDRIIIRPIVCTDECPYIVSGIVKYFDRRSHDWVATVDYGDGVCDDIATKTTKDGTDVFHMSDYK